MERPGGSSFVIGASEDYGTPRPAVGTPCLVHHIVRTWLENGSGEAYDGRKVDMWAVGLVLGDYAGSLEYFVDESRMMLRRLGSWLKENQTSDLGDVLEALHRLSLKMFAGGGRTSG